jgi:hypothetical protein
VSGLDRIRLVARDVPAYVTFRRWQREGFLKAFRRHWIWRKVLATPPVRTLSRSSDAVEVHIVCHRLDYLAAIWALKTFYHASRVDFPLVIHVNGAAGRVVFDRLRGHFPDATILTRDLADGLVEPRLIAGGFPRLAAARRASPFMIKLTDVPLLAEGAVVLGIDSDVLFFEEPREILERCARPTRGYLFQRDPESTYNISQADALREFGIRLAPRVNTGFLVYPRDLPDMAAFERYLGHPGVARPNGFIEQTLYALHASELEAVKYLPERYLIALQTGLSYDGLAARHFAGPTRPLLTSEGMPRVLQSGLLTGSRRVSPGSSTLMSSSATSGSCISTSP